MPARHRWRTPLEPRSTCALDSAGSLTGPAGQQVRPLPRRGMRARPAAGAAHRLVGAGVRIGAGAKVEPELLQQRHDLMRLVLLGARPVPVSRDRGKHAVQDSGSACASRAQRAGMWRRGSPTSTLCSPPHAPGPLAQLERPTCMRASRGACTAPGGDDGPSCCGRALRTSVALKARCSTMCATPRSCSSSATLPTRTCRRPAA